MGQLDDFTTAQRQGLDAVEQRQAAAARSQVPAAGMPQRRGALSPSWLFVALVVLLVGCCTTAVLAWSAHGSWAQHERRLADSNKKLRGFLKKGRTADNPLDMSRQQWKRRLEELQRDIEVSKRDVERKRAQTLLFGGMTGFLGVLFGGGLVVWIVIRRRQRGAYKQAQVAVAYGQQPAAAPGQQPAAGYGQPSGHGRTGPGYGGHGYGGPGYGQPQ